MTNASGGLVHQEHGYLVGMDGGHVVLPVFLKWMVMTRLQALWTLKRLKGR